MILVAGLIKCDRVGCSDTVAVQVCFDSKGQVDLGHINLQLPRGWTIHKGKFFCEPYHVDYELDD
jgi:hypothetical protein